MSPRSRFGAVAVLCGALVATVIAPAGPAAAAVSTTGQYGFDISYPQCGSVTSLPPPGAFDILGANDGIVYSANPCLAAEYGWAANGSAVVSFYANTADPGPSSSHWPAGQTVNGRSCPAHKPYRVGSKAYDDCSYIYGWDAAQDSLADAAAAAGASVADGAQWWLDVESANSWTRSKPANIADIQGGLDFFASHDSAGYVGIYTNSSSWSSITGGTQTLSAYPFWSPGNTASTAVSACGATSVTGGHTRYTQFQANNLDNDYDCG